LGARGRGLVDLPTLLVVGWQHRN